MNPLKPRSKPLKKLKNERSPRKVVNSKAVVIGDRKLTNMRYYFRSVDWAAMWEDWHLGVTESGSRKYKTLSDFIKEKAESKQQAEFLSWYLGPNDAEAEEEGLKYATTSAVGPQEWVNKRNTGGWFSDKSMKALAADISRRMTALECLRECGNRVGLQSVIRTGQLASQLDTAFQGTFLLPGLSLEKMEYRAKMYLDLLSKIQGLQAQAQELYAKSHGINFDDMAGLVRIYEASAMAAQQQAAISGSVETKEQAAIKAFTEMTLAKHQRYNMPIPQDAEAKIVDAIVEVEARAERKKKLQ